MSDIKKLRELAKDIMVLYVEDNETLRVNAQKLLKKFFRIVSVAQDGAEGLERFEKHKYPIVITDIKMPKMDGVTLTKKIKKIAPKTHVIVMSAFDDKEYLLELIEYGIFKFLKKPVTPASLYEVLYTTVLKIKEENKARNPIRVKEKKVNVEKKELDEDENLDNETLLFEILINLKKKEQKIELHNYYKGLSITNDAEILSIMKNSIRVKTAYLQKKAIKYEKRTNIVSEDFPFVVESTQVKHLGLGEQIVELQDLKFTKTSATHRETMRVFPKDGYKVLLFMHDLRVAGNISIEDISLNSVRISLEALPAGLRYCEDIIINIVLEQGLFEFTTEVKLLKIDESREKFYIVFLFENIKRSKIVKYITKRHMEIIREFKGLENG